MDEPEANQVSRRKALAQLGIGGAIAWTAPVVSTFLTPAAAATCTQPTFVGSVSGTSTATSLTLTNVLTTLPAGTYVLALAMLPDGNASMDATPPSTSWATLQSNTRSQTRVKTAVFGYRLTAGDDTLVFGRSNNSGGDWSVLLVGYCGVGSTPIDIPTTPAGGTVSGDGTATAVTSSYLLGTTGAFTGSRAVFLSGGYQNNTWGTTSSPGLGTFTPRAEAPSATGVPEGFVADAPAPASTTVGTISTTLTPPTGGRNNNVAFAVVLRK